jgi:hypothetical protein
VWCVWCVCGVCGVLCGVVCVWCVCMVCVVCVVYVCVYVCVCVSLGIQHAMCKHLITLPSVDCLFLPHFPTLPHKRQDFRGGKQAAEHKMCFYFLYNFCLKHFSI